MPRDPWRDSCPDFPDLLSRLSRLKLSARLCNFGLNPDAAQYLARLCPDFPDFMSRLSRMNLSVRLCNLNSNPNAARALARLVSRLSKSYVHTFQTQTLGLTLHFGSKSGCSALLGATHVQTFQTFCPDFPDSNSRRDSSLFGLSPYAAQYLARLLSTLSRLYVQTFQKETLGAIMQFGCKSE